LRLCSSYHGLCLVVLELHQHLAAFNSLALGNEHLRNTPAHARARRNIDTFNLPRD